VTVFGGGMHLVHETQIQRNASVLLDRARRAEAGNDLEKAEQSLRAYLNIKREDAPAWEWYARVVDQRETEHRRRERVFLIHEQALRHNPGDLNLERRCADLALELERYNDARHHLMNLRENLLDKVPKDSQGQPAAAELAELADLLGQCHRGLTQYQDADDWFNTALQHDPRRVSCYDRLARLRRNDLRRNDAADGTIQEMVAKNTEVARAYLYRWRYEREFSPPADASDIAEALKLAPDDPEVLLTAAVASEQKQDAASARLYWEKGWKLDPKNAGLAVGLARLEAREKHLEQAESVLRQSFEANPSVYLAFELAENLIIQGKIEGKDRAARYIAYLRARGLGDTGVRYLEARILFQQQKWAEAIPKLEMARAVLKSDSALSSRLNLMLADCYKRLGSDEQQLDALRQAAEGENGPEMARLELARALARSGKLDEALEILLPLAARQPELDLDIVRLMIQKTLRLPWDQRRWQEVDKRLEQAEKALPGKVEDLTAIRAELLGLQGKPDAAKEILEQAIERNPKSVRSRIALAALLEGRQDIAQAEKVLDRAEKDLGASPALLRARVGFWSRRGGDEAKKAINQLAESRHQVPALDQPVFLDELATAFYRLGDPVRAGQLWGELSQLQPENLEILSRRADLAIAASDRPAVEEIVGAIKRIEGDQGTLWRYAEATFLLGDAARRDATTSEAARKAAGNLVEEILARRGNWWGGLMLRGRLAELTSKPDDAIRDYLKAIDLGANQPGLARRLFVLLYQRQQFDQIDQVVQKLTERGMAPDDLTLATALNALRRKEFDRALTLARGVIPADSKSSPDLLILFRILMSAGQTQEAEKRLNRALQLAPGIPDVWISKVQFLREAGRKGEIPRVLDQAARALPKDQATKTLAICHATAGNDAEAAKLFQSALVLNPDDPPTLRLAADYYIKVLNLDKAEPLIAKLLDPRTKATAADMAWARRSEGLNLMRSGDQRQIDKAIALVDQNLKENQYNFEDQRARVILLSMKANRREEAIHELEALDRSRLLTVADRFLLAQLYRGIRDWPKCQAQLLGLVKERKPEPDHLAYFVSLLLEQGQLDQAEHWLGEFKPADRSQNLAFLDLKSRLLKARNHDPELLALLREHSTGHADQIGAVADLFERYGHLKDAEQAYRSFVAENTKEPLRVLALARFLARHDRVQEALALCEEAWKTCPPEPVAAASMIILSSGKDVTDTQRRQVESWLEDALKRQPSSIQIRLKLAALRTMQRRYDQTESIYRDVLFASLNNVEALNNLAWLLAFQTGKEHEALELINRAIDIAGSNPTLFDTRAVIYLQLGKTDQALEDLHAALAISPEKSVLYFHLARALEMVGNPAQAREALHQAEQRGLKVETMDPLEREIFLKARQKLTQS